MPKLETDADDNFHEEAWALIPWYVNGSLDAPDAARVAAHVATCSACAAEVRGQTRLMHAVQATDALAGPAETRWEHLRARLATETGSTGTDVPNSRGRRVARRARRPELRRIKVYAIAASVAAAVAVVVVTHADRGPSTSQEGFHTLTTPEATDARRLGQQVLRILAAEGASPERIAEIARGAGLRVLHGPTKRGVYTLAPADDAAVDTIAAALETHPEIDFASVRRAE